MEQAQRREDSLAARLRAGEHSAADQLIDIYYEQIYLFLRRLGHNQQVSEDLTQETFMHAWRNIARLRSDKALTGWIYRIASNSSKLYWRRHKNTELTDMEILETTCNSQNNTAQSEQLGLLQKAILKLPVKLRQAVVLHYMQQLTISEAAEVAGIKEGTFKSRLHRALKALHNDMS